MKSFFVFHLFEEHIYQAQIREVRSTIIQGYDYLIDHFDESILQRFGSESKVVQWDDRDREPTGSLLNGDNADKFMDSLKGVIRAYLARNFGN